MKIAVVDDMQLYRDKAKNCIKKYYDNDTEISIDCYDSGDEYLDSGITYDLSLIHI